MPYKRTTEYPEKWHDKVKDLENQNEVSSRHPWDWHKVYKVSAPGDGSYGKTKITHLSEEAGTVGTRS